MTEIFKLAIFYFPYNAIAAGLLAYGLRKQPFLVKSIAAVCLFFLGMVACILGHASAYLGM